MPSNFKLVNYYYSLKRVHFEKKVIGLDFIFLVYFR